MRAIVLLIVIVAIEARRWDSLVDEYFPNSCPKENIFAMNNVRVQTNKIFSPKVTQADVDLILRQGDRLSKATNKIISDQIENFSSAAERLFFTSKLSPEVERALKNSKSTLLAAKILQNKLTSCGEISPNTFVAFLASMKFKTPKTKRAPHCSIYASERSLDGTCNNLQRPLWGAANTAFSRIASTSYEDGLYTMPVDRLGKALPSTRTISSKLFSDKRRHNRRLTNIFVQWGQFLAHDLSLRAMEQADYGGIQCCKADGSGDLPDYESHPACAAIMVPLNDSFYSQYNIRCLNYVRSVTVIPADGSIGPAEQMNTVSSFLDASPVYGSKNTKTNSLRSFRGGRMQISPQGFLPGVTNVDECCDIGNSPACPCYSAGDGRVNQTPLLAALQTVFVREHNRLAQSLQMLNPHWSEEKIFQESRKILIAQIQHVTYHEWLPLCIGKDYVRSHKITPIGLFSYDYDSNVNPGIINSFATGAFRFFHTLIPGSFMMCSTEDYKGSKVRLSDYFFKPDIIQHYPNGLEAILRGASAQPCMEADCGFSEEVTQYLFKSINQSGIDLVAIDIQRGRDHGLARYNEYRTLCGLKKANDFEDLKDEIPQMGIDALKSIYEHVDDIDLFVGGMMESDIHGSLLGPTFQCIVGEQFYRTRVGDRFFYDTANKAHSFTPEQLQEIKKTSIARLICENSSIQKIQIKPFQTINEDNPVFKCSDFENIPFVNLNAWKEF